MISHTPGLPKSIRFGVSQARNPRHLILPISLQWQAIRYPNSHNVPLVSLSSMPSRSLRTIGSESRHHQTARLNEIGPYKHANLPGGDPHFPRRPNRLSPGLLRQVGRGEQSPVHSLSAIVPHIGLDMWSSPVTASILPPRAWLVFLFRWQLYARLASEETH